MLLAVKRSQGRFLRLAATGAGARVKVAAVLFDTSGVAIMMRADADDHGTDPDGKGGGPIACGAVMRAASSTLALPA
jgi:hypothetical protein